jgi:hypothetical protein
MWKFYEKNNYWVVYHTEIDHNFYVYTRICAGSLVALLNDYESKINNKVVG